jgi:autonomous glycyl radical cofactor GrcA
MAKKKKLPPIEAEPLIQVGEEVRVILSRERGIVEQVDVGAFFPVITVRVNGYAARYNSNQLKRMGE